MPTNNHNFSMPARGAEDWDADWYTNFDALDERVVLRGPAADRTTYTSYTDTLYFATDTEEVYRGLGDGAGWEQLESFGENPTFGALSAASASVSGEMTAGSVSADVAGINQTQRSGRVGSAVYYDPANKGPYVDGQQAYADVPEGGTFVIADGRYDVSTEGPLHSTVPKHIIGSGVAQNAENVSEGTQIYSQYADGPVIQFDGTTVNDTPERATVANLALDQRAATTHPLIRINDVTQSLIRDVNIGAAGHAATAVSYEGRAFFARQYRNRIDGWTDRGVSVTGTGYAHEFLQNFVSSGAGTNHTALYCNTNRPIVIGGQYSAVGTGGCAIHLDADGAAKYGGQLIEPGIEQTEVPLRIGGGFTRHSARAYFFIGHMNTVTAALDLANSNYGFYAPTYASSSGVAPLVDYGSSSTGNVVEVPSHLLQDKTILGSPGIFEAIRVPGVTRAGTAMNFPTGSVPIMCEHWDGTQGTGPAWHDTTDWRIANSTAFTL